MIALAAVAPRPPDQRSIPAAVEFYQAGDWRRALDSLDAPATTITEFTKALDAWASAAGAASEGRRRFVAAAFALDTVWVATRSWAHVSFVPFFDRLPKGTEPLDSRQSLGVIATWAARQMPAAGAVTPAERALWLAAIGVAEDGGAWRALQTDILPLAGRRLPDEPRVHLATVLASADLDLGPLRSKIYSTNLNLSVLREENLPSRVTGHIPGAIQSLRPLLTEASLAGEVELRIGYLELRRRQWPEALKQFDAVRRRTEDSLLRATADYMAGWVQEQLGQLDEAVAAYRRALIPFPAMRNLATRLAALLFLRDERVEGYAILDRALNARPIPVDLLTSLERGDGRFVGDWLAAVRQGLPGMGHP
jgi:tetratricopeptide (TPR) repeat protein